MRRLPVKAWLLRLEPALAIVILLFAAYFAHAAFGLCAGRATNRAEVPAAAAADFSLGDLEGATTSLGTFRGRVVVLNFWATWCPPCRAEIPELMKLRTTFAREDLALVGIATDEAGSAIVGPFVAGERFELGRAERPINYPVLLGTSAVVDAYRIERLPTTVVIDRAGREVERLEQPVRAAQLEPEIRRLLSVSAAAADAAPGRGQHREAYK
jgi:thiol-disulfide isomerase/thioredoxin